MPEYVADYLNYMAECLPESRIIVGALLGIVLLAGLSWLGGRSRLTRLREAALYVIAETDRRVGIWLQLHPELAAEPGSLGREGPLGTSDLVVIVEQGGSKELNSRFATAAQVIVSLAILGAALHVIISKQHALNDTMWACGIVGAVIGYWLQGK